MALLEPREFTPGQWFKLYLERADRSQSDVVHALDQKEQERLVGARDGEIRHWRWTIVNLAQDKKRLSTDEYVAVAEELQLSRAETLRFLRSADVYPSLEEMVAAVASVRPLLNECPWPAYVVTYRLNEVVAWNAVTASIYNLGLDDGPDVLAAKAGMPGSSSSGLALDLVSTLFDPNGPVRPLLEAAGHEEWRGFVRQQLAYFLSYWEPLRLWGDPDWLDTLLRRAETFPEFKGLWREAQIERLQSQLGTTRGLLHDRTYMAVGEYKFLLEVHTIIADPRLELLIQVPQDRQTAGALLNMG